MFLSELEKFVFHKGLQGCPLNDVPADLLNTFPDSKLLEIVKHENNLELPSSLVEIPIEENAFDLESLENRENFDIRWKLEYWRRLAFKGYKQHSMMLAKLIVILCNEPNGITKEQISTKYGKAARKIVVQYRDDRDPNKLFSYNEQDQTYHYINEWVMENKEFPDDLFTSNQYAGFKKHTPDVSNTKKKSIESSTEKIESPFLPTQKSIENSVELSPMKSKLVDDEKFAQIETVVKQHEKGVTMTYIRQKFNLNSKESFYCLEEFKKRKGYLVSKDRSGTKILSLGEMENKYFDNEMVKFLIDICLTTRIFLLSDLPKELKKMLVTMNMSDDQFIGILEDQDFNTIEIRSKFIGSELVIFSNSVNEEDPDLLDAFERAKTKISNYFNLKVKQIFLKNVFMNSFDNNYSSLLKERVMYFYKFIHDQIKLKNDFFHLTNESLLQMSFSSFVRCVPFRSDFQFLKIAFEAAKKFKFLKNYFLNFKTGIFDEITSSEFENINIALLKEFQNITVADLLDAFKVGSDFHKNISSRINVYEFERIVYSLVKYNIFEGFSTAEYFYFEQIEGIEKYIDKVLSEINDDASETAAIKIPYPIRKDFYDQICDFSQDEFIQKATELTNSLFENGTVKDFFMKKIQSFK
jgi:hypothetical protein